MMARFSHQKKALSTSQSSGCLGKLFLAGFFGVFLAFGLFFGYLMGNEFLFPYLRSGNFAEVPCKITRSELTDFLDDGSRMYRADIEYDYDYQGKQYHSDKTGFGDSSGSMKSAYQKMVERYPLGSQQICFVDPDKPDYAVLERRWSWWLMVMVLPLIFVLVGVGGIVGSLLPSRPKQNKYFGTPGGATSANELAYGEERESNVVATSLDMILKNQPFPLYDAGLVEKPRELSTTTSPAMILGCAIIVATIWNGFTWVAIVSMLSEKGNHFGLLFMSIFALIGLGLIGWVIYQFLALFNPKPTLNIDRSLLPLGSTSQLSWRFSSTPTSMTSLVIKLVGEEEAQYRRGTDTVTDKKTFYERVLFESLEPSSMEQGTVEVEIPNNSIHTFNASNNKYRWKITLKGDIPRWPDVMHDYELMVCPHEPMKG